MKEYSFLELSNLAQIKAVYDYVKGWAETHDEDDLSFHDAYDILVDNVEDAYSKDGTLLEDNWEEI